MPSARRLALAGTSSAATLAAAAEFRLELERRQHEQSERLARLAAAPADRAAVPVHRGDRAARRSTVLADAFARRRRRARARRRLSGEARSPERSASRSTSVGRRRTASSSAAAPAASARRRPPPRSRSRARGAAATPSSSRSTRPSASPTRSGSSSSRTPHTRSSARAGTATAPRCRRPAVSGADARHQVDVRHARRAVRATTRRRPSAILDNRFYRNVAGSLVGHAGVHGDGEALRAPRRRRLRPDRRRHAADPPRARLPRRAAPAHAPARQPHLPVADDAGACGVPRGHASRRRPSCARSRGSSAPR